MPQKTGKGTALDKKGIKVIRRQLQNAVSFVRSREMTQAISRVTLNEVIASALVELVGDDSSNLRETEEIYSDGQVIEAPVTKTKVHGRYVATQMDRVDALSNSIHKLIEQLMKIDPQTIESALAAREQDQLREPFKAGRKRT